MQAKQDRGGIIYGCRNKANGKWYVGQTVHKLTKRLSGHLSRSRKGSDQAFHEALRKYGVEGFSIQVLVVCKSKAEMDAAERFWIVKLNSMAHNGYNLTDGGEGSIPCEEVRQKMRESKKGRIITEEWRENLRKARKGRVYTEETRAKMSAWQTGRKRPDVAAAQRGRKLSEETKKKISEAVSRSMTPERRAIIAEQQRKIAESRFHLTKKAAEIKRKAERDPSITSRKGGKFTEEHKARISAALRGKPKPWLIGRKRSPETVAKMVAAQKGKKHSWSTKGKPNLKARGQKRSGETRDRISAALKGKPKPWMIGNRLKADWIERNRETANG